jgi:hypothetical protein
LGPAALVSVAIGCHSELSVRNIYGAWQLESAENDSAATHVLGEVLQLAPGGEATIVVAGQPPRRVRFQSFRGEDAFGTGGQLMIALEGVEDTFIVEMPTGNRLTLAGNRGYGRILTFRRAR